MLRPVDLWGAGLVTTGEIRGTRPTGHGLIRVTGGLPSGYSCRRPCHPFHITVRVFASNRYCWCSTVARAIILRGPPRVGDQPVWSPSGCRAPRSTVQRRSSKVTTLAQQHVPLHLSSQVTGWLRWCSSQRATHRRIRHRSRASQVQSRSPAAPMADLTHSVGPGFDACSCESVDR